MVQLDGGHGRISDALPVREVAEELIVRYQIRIYYKSYFYGFQRNAFARTLFSMKGSSTKCFQQNYFHKMQEKYDGGKLGSLGY